MAFVKLPRSIYVNTQNITSLRIYKDTDKDQLYLRINFIHHYDHLNFYHDSPQELIDLIMSADEPKSFYSKMIDKLFKWKRKKNDEL